MENVTEIGGRKYAFGFMTPMEAVTVEVSIIRAIGEPLFKSLLGLKALGDKKAAVEDNAQMAIPLVATAIGMLAKNLDADELKSMMKTLLKYVSCNGEHIKSIDETFMRRNRELWEVTVYALRYNFQDFFSESLLASFKNRASQVMQQFNPSASTGTSGDQ